VIVLGVDPSLCNVGLAAVRLFPDREEVVATAVVRTEPSAKKRKVAVSADDERRVSEITAGLDRAITEHRPHALVMEAPAGSKGARAARSLGLVVGAVVAVAWVRGIPLVQVTPLDVKRATTGRKTADKDDVIAAVERRYPGVVWPEPWGVVEHAADAIGAVMAALPTETLRMARRLTEAA
jgi:crossover junction endodeoxyribonuclease RuvC